MTSTLYWQYEELPFYYNTETKYFTEGTYFLLSGFLTIMHLALSTFKPFLRICHACWGLFIARLTHHSLGLNSACQCLFCDNVSMNKRYDCACVCVRGCATEVMISTFTWHAQARHKGSLFVPAESYQLFQPCLSSLHQIHPALSTRGSSATDLCTSEAKRPQIRPAASSALGYVA